MTARRIKEVISATTVSIGLLGCAASEANSPPGGDAGPAPSTGTGGFTPVPGGGGTPVGQGGQVGNGGSIPPLGTGGAPPAGNGGSSGVSGSTSAGGQSSAGGGGPGSVPVSPDNSIDTLEDADGSIDAKGGRVGAWYTFHDATAGGTQDPEMGTAFVPQDCGHESVKCAHTSGMGFKDYGAGFGFDLNNTGTAKGVYSVGAFTGITFWAKGTPFRLNILTSATVPPAEGGSCATTKCSDNFGTAIAATADYKQFVVPFSSLTQEGWGDKTTWDPTKVLAVQFKFPPNVNFDVSIDDVYLY